MEQVEIRYLTGYMCINVPEFFPCEQARARKVFKLIKDFCPAEVRSELGRHLYLLSREFSSERTALRRAVSNYSLYCKMEVDDEWLK